MILTGPKQLVRDDDFIEATVEAKYTFGGDVQGTVKLNATLITKSKGQNLTFFERSASLV